MSRHSDGDEYHVDQYDIGDDGALERGVERIVGVCNSSPSSSLRWIAPLRRVCSSMSLHVVCFVAYAVVVCFAVVSIWRGLWYCMDLWVFPRDALNWTCYGAGLLVVCTSNVPGVLVHVYGYVWPHRDASAKACASPRKRPLPPLLLLRPRERLASARATLRRALDLYVLFGVVAAWRGLWYAWDDLTMRGDRWSAWTSLVVSGVCSHLVGAGALAVCRHAPSVLAPPLCFSPDPPAEQRTLQTQLSTLFRALVYGDDVPDVVARGTVWKRVAYFLLSTMDYQFGMIFICFGVVSFWRGSWILMDAITIELSPQSKLWTSIVTLAAGYILLVGAMFACAILPRNCTGTLGAVASCSGGGGGGMDDEDVGDDGAIDDSPTRWVRKTLRCTPCLRIGVDVLSFGMGWVCVVVWRGWWYVLDEVLFRDDASASCMASIALGCCLLHAMNTFTSTQASPAMSIPTWECGREWWDHALMVVRMPLPTNEEARQGKETS